MNLPRRALLVIMVALATLAAACSGGGDASDEIADAGDATAQTAAGSEGADEAAGQIPVADGDESDGDSDASAIPGGDDGNEAGGDSGSTDGGDAGDSGDSGGSGADDGGQGTTQTSIPQQNGNFADIAPREGEAVYTGQGVMDESVLDRPALAVKIDNVDAARPQAGINEADIVFEEMVEGGLTRLLAVYHSEDPPLVGPVRSARSTDIALLMPLANPLFAWSGSNAAFVGVLRNTAIVDVGVDANPSLYTRDDDRDAPSNLFASPARLRDLTPETALTPRPMFDFARPREVLGAGATSSNGVDIDFGSTEVSFRWDDVRGGWARSQNGTEHVDDNGRQVAPANVIIQFSEYVNLDLVDSNGAPVPEAQVFSGRGEAWFFANGELVQGTWYKENVTRSTIFLDADGNRIKSMPGRTWIILAPVGSADIVS